jgi:hypothetical protein
MKEKEWLSGTFIYDLVSTPKCRDDRKRRLLFSAIARRSLSLLPDPEPFEKGLQFCENWADGDFDRSQWT